MAGPARIPFMFGLSKAKFKPENIFMWNGHGVEDIDGDRYPLKDNEYAMIPGGCGLTIQATHSLYYNFYNPSIKVNIFNKNIKRVSNKLGIKYKTLEELPEGDMSPIKESSQFQIYYPGSMINEERTVPSLKITPFMISTNVLDGKKYILFELSGILSKNKPVGFTEPFDDFKDQYSVKFEYTEGDLNETLSNSRFTPILKDILYGSLISYDEIIQMTGKTEDEITLNEIMEFTIPLSSAFEFISSKIKEPYLLIVMTCRSVPLEKIPKTPSRAEIIKRRREEQIAVARAMRRQSSAGLNNIPSVIDSAKAGSGSASEWLKPPSVGLGALGYGLGGTRRKKRQHKKRLTRRKKLKTDK